MNHRLEACTTRSRRLEAGATGRASGGVKAGRLANSYEHVIVIIVKTAVNGTAGRAKKFFLGCLTGKRGLVKNISAAAGGEGAK